MYKPVLPQKALSGFITTFHTYCSYPNLKLFSIRVVGALKYSPGKQSLPAFKEGKKKCPLYVPKSLWKSTC